MTRHSRFAVPLGFLLLAGCVTPPDLGPKPIPRTPESVAATRSLAPAPGAAWPGDRWWTDYGDAQLSALIEEALQGAPDVAAAAARLQRARGLTQQAGAATLPTLDAQGRAGYDRQSLNLGFPDTFKPFLPHGWQESAQVAGTLAFDLDLWGKNRAALAAATSEERAAALDLAQARTTLATGIASSYADLARLYDERDVRLAALEVRNASRKLVGDRQVNGLETRGSLRQADAEAATARAALGETEQAIAVRQHQIAALMGAGPDRGLAIARPALPAARLAGVPEGTTTALVARRPDIVAARERVEAAARRIRVARADFFPSIRLSALVGVQAFGFDNLIAKDSLYGSAGPAIDLPIFDAGARRGRYRGARADYDLAVAAYDQAVVTAYQDAADAVTGVTMIAQRLADARAAVAASQDAYTIAQGRYRAGLSNYLDVLAVEDRLLAARLAAASLEAAARSADIALIRALGGGFAGISQDTHTHKDQSHG